MADRLALALPPWAEGVLVVGDVHGQLRLFQAAVDLAEAERRYVLSLGDLVDRGPDNAGCVRLMLDLLGRKAGSFVRGNHDDKLHRTLKGNPTNVDSDLAVTLEQLDAAPDAKALKRGFCSAFRAAPFVVALGSSVMVHGAFARAMLASRTFHPRLKALALYGEATPGGPATSRSAPIAGPRRCGPRRRSSSAIIRSAIAPCWFAAAGSGARSSISTAVPEKAGVSGCCG
ncbi:MAG: metallophosphoesterase [Geminicoccaceae bacterium]